MFMRLSAWISVRVLCLGVLVFGSTVTSASAQQCTVEVPGEIFCDDFEMDTSGDWRLGLSSDQLVIADGVATLSGTHVPAMYPRQFRSQADISTQIVGRAIAGVGFGIVARSGVGSYYTFVGTGENGSPAVELAEGGARIEEIQLIEDFPFDAFEEPVAMQFDLFGDQLRYWVWPADELRPEMPLGTVTDNRFSSGGMGLFTGDVPFENFGAAEFEYIKVATEHIASYEPIPEPSAVLLAACGFVGLIIHRRLRSVHRSTRS